jgi:DNA polymerase III delta subunit
MTAPAAASLAYFWGHDAYGLEHAARELAAQLAAVAGQPLETWRTSGDDDEPTSPGANGGAAGGEGPSRRRTRLIDEIGQRVATSPLFGAGVLVVVRQPGALMRETSARQRLVGLLPSVAPGNALCFTDLLPSGSKTPAHSAALREAVTEAGGTIREFPALSRERMEAFVATRARELGVTLEPGAARLLAERVGAYVREGDIDRRRHAELANAELEKLALFRPAGTVTREDVRELVSEAVPGSTWALLDAVGARRGGEAATLAERLLASGTALPVLVSQLHRRLRELIVVREHLDAGAKPAELVRALKAQPYRAQKLAEQARAWQPDQLDQALAALLEVDMLSKGIAADGSPHSLSDDRSWLALMAWLGERVRRVG